MTAYIALLIVAFGVAGIVGGIVILSVRAGQQRQLRRTQSLHFTDNAGAFRAACELSDDGIREGQTLLAIVVDGREIGLKAGIMSLADGRQRALLRVQSSDGGFLVAAETATSSGPTLGPGDLVAWRAMKYSPEVANHGGKRFGWIGLITGTLRPEYNTASGWICDRRFES